jgi:hypothetical protein
MSLLNDASLILVPSAIKTGEVLVQKPLPNKFADETGNYDGNDPQTNANLTFTRASSATRVGPDGLIQRVRTNVLLQSNTFNTTWATTNASVTSGQSGYDGTNNAWELNSSASGGRILQSNTQAGLQTFSAYAKGSVSSGIRLYAFGTVNANAYFNLNLGTVGAIGGSGVTAKIEAVGGGWYRCSISFNQTNVNVRLYTSDNANAEAAGTIYIQNAQVETGDIATDYIATTTAAVSVGPVANLPRLDYLGSSCGKLLLEPQRTNSILWSEQMNNWGPTNTTVTTNVLVSPDGYQNADTIVINDSTSRVSQNLSLGAGTYTASVYAKLTSGSGTVRINLIVDGVQTAFTFTPTNEWERYTYTVTAATGVTAIQLRGSAGTPTVAFWGAQVEAGAYATSYIGPTLGSTVTRTVDNISTTFASAFAQSGGAAFIELKGSASGGGSSSPVIRLNGDKADNHYLGFGNTANWRCRIQEDGVAYLFTSPVVKTSDVKLCISYSSTGWAMFANGVKFASGSEDIDLGNIETITSSIGETWGPYEIKQMILFPTPLNDADAIALTA